MEEKLKIGRMMPFSGTSIKVKGLGSNKQHDQDRSFEKQLNEKGHKKKREHKEETTDRVSDIQDQYQTPLLNNSNSENVRKNSNHRQIDVLA